MKLIILMVVTALTATSELQAQENRLVGHATAKEALSIFREAQGFDLEIDSNKKIATISLLKQRSDTDIFSMQVIGKFDGTDTELANNEGLVNDVTLKVTRNHLFFQDKENSDEDMAELRAQGMKPLHQALYKCAKSFVPMTSDVSNLEYLNDLKGDDKKKVILNCKNYQDAIDKFESETNKITLFRAYDYFNYSFSYSPGSYKYYDLTSEKLDQSDTESYTAGAEYGAIKVYSSDEVLKRVIYNYDSLKWSMGIEFTKGDAKEEKSKTNVCQSIPQNDSFTKCFDTYLLPSFENESRSVYASIGMRAKESWLKGVEIIAKNIWSDKTYIDGVRNVDTSRFSLEAPLTIFVTEKYDVRAGLKFSWREKLKTDSKDFDKFSIGLFVTKGFNFEAN